MVPRHQKKSINHLCSVTQYNSVTRCFSISNQSRSLWRRPRKPPLATRILQAGASGCNQKPSCLLRLLSILIEHSCREQRMYKASKGAKSRLQSKNAFSKDTCDFRLASLSKRMAPAISSKRVFHMLSKSSSKRIAGKKRMNCVRPRSSLRVKHMCFHVFASAWHITATQEIHLI